MSTALWTLADIAAATGGDVIGQAEISGLQFDSRLVEAGDLFLALSGARDGHDFIAAARAKGAAAALVSQPVAGDLPHVRVPDVLRGLQDMAVAARVRAARRIAVTGSVGKTSVTQAILRALQLAGSAHGAVKSFNNHIGVPLTLARTPHGTDAGVYEVGMNRPGEIAPLAALVAPHVAVITTVAAVHIENFASEDAIADEKAAIFSGLVTSGTAILPADNPHAARLRLAASAAGAQVLDFGRTATAGRILDHRDTAQGSVLTAEIMGQPLQLTLGVQGAHWAGNAVAVLLVLAACGMDLQHGVQALARYRPLRGRGAQMALTLPGGAITLIDDSYNANPASMRAAFATLALHAGRRVAVLTDMLELGALSADAHAGLAQPLVDADVARVYCAGPEMRRLFDALPKSRQALWCSDAEGLVPALLSDLRAGDAVLVKGSNGSRAGRIVTALEDAALTGVG